MSKKAKRKNDKRQKKLNARAEWLHPMTDEERYHWHRRGNYVYNPDTDLVTWGPPGVVRYETLTQV